jgi:glucosamine kinase
MTGFLPFPGRRRVAEIYLGVDAGGSHCRVRVTDAGGQVLGSAEGGPANTRMGLYPLYDRLLSVTGEALEAAGIPERRWNEVAAGMGIAGIRRPGMSKALAALDFPFASISLDSDAAIANLGAHNGADGAILVLGTGSIGFAQIKGERFTVGGYGFPISDEGSGAALGLSAVRHALRAMDGRTKRTSLSKEIAGKFRHDTLRAIAWMDQAAPADYASFAPLVMDYAEAGDEIALSIVEDAVLHVERFIATIFARGAPRLALVGGLSARLRPWLRVRTAERLVEPLGDPVSGALLLARGTAVHD